LIAVAREAATRAYCPYSNYPVGAALLTREWQIVTGSNVENVSFGLTLCAERTALVKAVSDGMREFIALAVVGGNQTPAAPCGACRQVLAEFCAPDMPVFYARLTGGQSVATTVGALLPQAFVKT
jgi:cytidine deaminase